MAAAVSISDNARCLGRDFRPAKPLNFIASRTALRSSAGMGGYVYLMSNGKNGPLYLGVTNDVARRAFEHREGLLPGFTRDYGLGRLVWAEWHDDIRTAIQREKTMKHWPRAWKVRLIHQANPDWDDLYEQLNG